MNAQTPIPIPPGREAIAAAIETLIAVLDAMTPDADLEHAGDEFEDDDPAGGDICDVPHDLEMDAGYLAREAGRNGRSHAVDQRFIIERFGPRHEFSRLARTEAWSEASPPAKEGK